MKGKLSKAIGCFFICLFLLLGIAACGIAAEEAAADGDPTLQRQVQIRLATCMHADPQIMETIVEKYNKANKSQIEVTVQQIPRDTYSLTINMMMASANGPDVFEVGNEWLTSYIMQNWLADLSDYVDEEFLERFPSWASQAAQNALYGGAFYTVPAGISTLRLIYNRDLFKKAGLDPEKPPETMAEVLEFSRSITSLGQGYRNYGFALAAAEEWHGYTLPMEVACTVDGVYYFDFRKGQYDLQVYKEWIETFKSMKSQGLLFPGEGSLKTNTALAQFAEGNIGMMFVTNSDLAVFDILKTAAFKWDIAPPPSLRGTKQAAGKRMLVPTGFFAVNAKTGNLKEAAEVWKHMYSDEVLDEQYQKGTILPVVGNMLEMKESLPEIQGISAFLPQKDESLYPEAPRGIVDWARIRVYRDAFNGTGSMDKELELESQVLNGRLIITSEMEKLGFRYDRPDFDPMHPDKAISPE